MGIQDSTQCKSIGDLTAVRFASNQQHQEVTCPFGTLCMQTCTPHYLDLSLYHFPMDLWGAEMVLVNSVPDPFLPCNVVIAKWVQKGIGLRQTIMSLLHR